MFEIFVLLNNETLFFFFIHETIMQGVEGPIYAKCILESSCLRSTMSARSARWVWTGGTGNGIVNT